MTQVLVPDIGDFHDVEVIDVLVKVGDTIAIDTPLVTLETDKATMDVPSSSAGVIKSLAVKKGDRVSKGSVVLTVDAEAESGSRVAGRQNPETSQPAASPPLETRPTNREIQVLVPDIGDFHDVEV